MLKADDPNTMFVGNGDSIPGITGTIQHTKDGGQTWQPAELPVAPNSVVYWFGTHAAVPNVIAAASLYGYVYLSNDGGNSWGEAGQGVRRNPLRSDNAGLETCPAITEENRPVIMAGPWFLV